jgi:Zn-dependent protease with chaperone function
MATDESFPSRSDLLRQMEKANRFAWLVLATELLLIGLLAALVNWNRVVREPVMTAFTIAIMASPIAQSIAISYATKKKRVQDLKESTRFGQYDKYQLQKLFRDTLDKLRLPNDNLPLYIIASPWLNAYTSHLGFGWLFKSVNGIYLNRQTLHKLEPAEVQDIIGHELGHYYRYYLIVDRFRIVTITLGSIIGLLLNQWIGLDGLLAYILLSIASSAAWALSTLPYTRNATAIEYLCDDFGAQVNGVFPSIQGLLKIGLASELECFVMQSVILSKAASHLNPTELIDAITASIPYGQATREEIEQKVKSSVNNRAASQGKSLAGLLRYMWYGDQDEENAESLELEAKKMRKIQSLPRLDWEQVLQNRNQVQFNEVSLPRLIELIESRPTELLFRVPESSDGVHPPLRNRILYLWRHRTEIESTSGIRR